jgi:hypothetical protein
MLAGVGCNEFFALVFYFDVIVYKRQPNGAD